MKIGIMDIRMEYIYQKQQMKLYISWKIGNKNFYNSTVLKKLKIKSFTSVTIKTLTNEFFCVKIVLYRKYII